jgi:hypothetical protein
MSIHKDPAPMQEPMQSNDWPEPEVKRYPGAVIVLGIVLAATLLWSGCVFVSIKTAKLMSRPPVAAAASETRTASVGR